MNHFKLGNDCLLLRFEQSIDVEIHQQIVQLFSSLKEMNGVEYLIPSYCSIAVGFDPTIQSHQTILNYCEGFNYSKQKQEEGRQIQVPVCYDEEFALDWREMEEQTNLSFDEIIERHTSQTYRVYLLGFLPGFPYMGILPNSLHCKRKQQPRQQVAAQSVALAGAQTGIYPCESPGGWQIIGKTPLQLLDLTQSTSPTFFQIGDEVQFKAISKLEFLNAQARS